jgi:hypothetical protein
MLVRMSSVTCPARIAGPLADIAAALCAGKFGTYNVMHSTFKKISERAQQVRPAAAAPRPHRQPILLAPPAAPVLGLLWPVVFGLGSAHGRMQELVTPRAVIDGTTAGGCSVAAGAAMMGHLHALPPPEQEQRRLNNSLQEEPPPPLQMPTL